MLWALPFLLVIGVLLPLLAWSSFRYLATESTAPASLPSPSAMALQAIAVQAVVFALAWLALVRNDLPLSWASEFDAASLVATAIVVLAGLKLARLEARRPLGPSERLRRRLRSTGLTKLWFLAICSASIGEEFAYRGVLYLLMGQYLPPILAGLFSALLFGLGHFGQGWRGAILSSVFGLGLQAIVALSGGLFLAMLAHLLYDLGVVWLGRRLSLKDSDAAV